ncbi:MAG: rhomboid family intramembrane serine protease [Verrucomicrobia bacterium]|nr:rhomboid family intramembrane serine protease [Verrucomicrobiota bacterium]
MEKPRPPRRYQGVTDALIETAEAPVWARDEAFPPAPNGWGWTDTKGHPHPCESLAALATAVGSDRNGTIYLVWTPAAPRMCLPEEIDGLSAAVAVARERWTREDLDASTERLRWSGLVLAGFSAYAFFHAMAGVAKFAAESGQALAFHDRLKLATRAVLGSTTLGLGLLVFVVFVFIPWYQARKRRTDLENRSAVGTAAGVSALRFETWLELQRAPVTKLLLGLMGLVALAQLLPGDSVATAGLVKVAYLRGEWWRLLTAPFLHGNIVHFLMNMTALIYLGRRLEVFARWPHLPLVFLFAAAVGGEASARFVSATSVGASGGLMGWLGFLIVFETLHGKLVPRSARRRLVAGVLLTAFIGLLGYRFIDNAAHLGGLLAGMTYAAIVFPPSASPKRPGSTLTDRLAGSAALGALMAAAGLAVWRIAGG